MHVGLDITPIIYGRGVSRYTSNLVRFLAKQPAVKLSLFGYSSRQKRALQKFVGSVPHTESVVESYPQILVDYLWRFGFHQIRSKLPQIDVFHSWDWLQPPDLDLPMVSTIHDLAEVKFPETAHPKILKMHQRSWKILRERQADIIAVSHATKKDIVELLGIPTYKIHVVHEALPEEFRQTSLGLTDEMGEIIKQKLQLTKPFLLFVGTREPRKNLARLIEAWQPIAATHELIIAGEPGWDETHRNKRPGLRFLGKISDQELAVLYGEAEVFCYPSLHEGFGLPILEAFFHGTPVVTATVSSMPEVAGNAAELVNPLSVESIHQGIVKILNEPLTDQKKRLQRMIIRLQMFTWERIAAETVAVYQHAYDNAHRD